MPLVSVITPIYNCQSYLQATVLSVINQTFYDWELILVDDKSGDESLMIAQQLAKEDNRIRVISLDENSGAAVARNKGIDLAEGRYIAFLDSDDMWLPEKLEKQISFMERENVAFSYSAYKKVDEHGNDLGTIGVPAQVSYTDLLKVCSIGCLTAVYDTESLGKVYMPMIRKRQDLGLWLKILKRIPFAYGINETLALYRVRNNSISANKLNAASYTWKLYREIEKLNIFYASYVFVCYAINGLFRSRFPKLARKLNMLH